MKKIVLFLVFILWTIYAGILVAGYVEHERNEDKPLSTPAPVDTAALQGVTLSTSEVAKHNTQNDCWIIISDNAYNISAYFNSHPGANSTMIPYCGKEATQAFTTKDKVVSKDHSSYAYSLLKIYLLGKVGETIGSLPKNSTDSIQTNVPKTAPSSSSTNTKLSLAEVAKHNAASNCWLVINSKVYNVTSYLGSHPGGVSTITPYCGKGDASGAFGGLPHSSRASNLLSSYLVGSIGATVINTTPKTAPSVNKMNGEDGED